MKKVIAWLLVLALTAAVSIGATLAYLTDTDEDVNVMTLGKVKIDQLEYERIDDESQNENAEVQEFHDNKPLYPAVTENGFDYTPGTSYVDWTQIGKDGYTSDIWDPAKINNEVDKMVFVKNKGTYDAYVRTVFAFEAGNYETKDQFLSMVHLNLNDTDWTWEWAEEPVAIGESTYFIATATYNKILEPGAYTEISLSQISLDKTATNEDVAAFGETYQVLVKSQAIQSDGFDDAVTALNEGFGVIAANSIPWDGDAATTGTDVFTALNYLNGGTEQITKKVTNIVFGLNEDYPAVINENKGTLVDVEQDVPVYAYYVDNGGSYDVYLLASDTIYAPADSSNLCNGMSNLKTVDTSNLDMSRTTNMYRMFRDCTSLQSLDVSDWDVSNVTNMRDLFRACKSLPFVDVAQWDTGNVTTMLAAFQDCILMESIELSDWDTSSVVDMTQMFNRCTALKTLDLSNWDVRNLTVTQLMFQQCTALVELNVAGWNTCSLENMSGMFNHCEVITEIDVSDWDVSNVSNFGMAFQSCFALKELDVSNWDTSSATAMGWMFWGCNSIELLDVSNWDVSNVTVMSHMFRGCNSLLTMPVDNWDVSKVESMDALFHSCRSLTTINVSNWDTGNVREFSQMFEGDEKLVEIVGMGNWDTSNARTFDETFSYCYALKELDLSSFDTRNVTPGFKAVNGDKCRGFEYAFIYLNSLEKLIIGPNVVFSGNGTVAEGHQIKLPNPVPIDGVATKWYNAENDTYYDASEIPEKVAATYVAKVPPVTP